MMMIAAPTKVRVRFAVERDEQAAKISALLEALGYEVVRDLAPDTAQTRLRWAVSRLKTMSMLTEREADILEQVLQGKSNAEIGAALQISKATVKWHLHNVFTKTGTSTRESLLREALQLGGVTRRVAASDDATDVVEGLDAIEIEDNVEDGDEDDDDD
jgi:DNA-binding CsgD family transcriptional regulator